MKWVKRARRLFGAKTLSGRTLGDQARNRGDFVEAARLYRAYLAKTPSDFPIWVQLGHALKENGRLRDADKAYATGQALKPDDADVLLHRGHLAKVRGDYREAAALFHQSYAIDHNAHAANALLDPVILAIDQEQAAGDIDRRRVGAVERLTGHTLVGWALDPENEHEPAEVEIIVDDQTVMTGRVSIVRDDVLAGGFPDVAKGFRFDLEDRIDWTKDVSITARLKRTGEHLAQSPFRSGDSTQARQWLKRNTRLDAGDVAFRRRQADADTAPHSLTIVMAVRDTEAERLRQALDSVLDQWCSRWTLICVVADTAGPVAVSTLQDYAGRDARIRIVMADPGARADTLEKLGVASAEGDHILPLRADGYLEPEAVFRLLDAARHGVEVIYGDEIITGDAIDDLQAFVSKPAYSHDHFLSRRYFADPVCFRRDLAQAVAQKADAPALGQYGFALEVLESARFVAHVPAWLCRTRGRSQDMVARHEQDVEAVNQHLRRTNRPSRVSAATDHTRRIDEPVGGGRALVVVGDTDRIDRLKMTLDAVLATTDRVQVDVVVLTRPSRGKAFSSYLETLATDVRVVDLSRPDQDAIGVNAVCATAACTYRHLLFLEPGMEPTQIGWLERLTGLADRPDVGVVGAGGLTPDGERRRAAVFIDAAGPDPVRVTAVQPLGVEDRVPSATQDCLAVSADCLIVRSEVFDGVGGFDETLSGPLMVTDLCLRIGSLGYRVLDDPFCDLQCGGARPAAQAQSARETARFDLRWGPSLVQGDPFSAPAPVRQGLGEGGITGYPERAVRVRATRPDILPFEIARARRTPPPAIGPGVAASL